MWSLGYYHGLQPSEVNSQCLLSWSSFSIVVFFYGMVTVLRCLISEESDPIIASNHADLLVRGKIHIRNLQSALEGVNTWKWAHDICLQIFMWIAVSKRDSFFSIPSIQPRPVIRRHRETYYGSVSGRAFWQGFPEWIFSLMSLKIFQKGLGMVEKRRVLGNI